MADDVSQDERTEEASPKRRQEFRDRGEVAKSVEIPSVVILFTAMVGLYYMGPGVSRRVMASTTMSFQNISQPDLTVLAVQTLAIQEVGKAAMLLAPLAAVLMVAAALANLLQTGWLVAPEAMTPDIKRINPVGKFQSQLFSTKTLFELGKNLGKALLVGGPIVLAVQDELALVPVLLGKPADLVVTQAVLGALRVVLKVAALLILIAIADYSYQVWSMERRMRMTREEVKQELKQSEGDPMLKGRRRSKAREMSMNRMMAAVPTADVVVTNPTHFSVALKYDLEQGGAPKVVAKGQDLVAFRIRELARRSQVPVVENPPLCRTIYQAVKLGQEIPEALYRAVAELLAVVYKRQGARPQPRGER